MTFDQKKFSKSVEQTRNIFNKYVYKTNDTVSDVIVPGYFAESRFNGEDGWIGGIIEVQCSDGYAIIEISENNESSVKYSTTSMNAGFIAVSNDTISVSSDQASPSFLTGFDFSGSGEFELFDQATGAVKNVSDRTIRVQGSISYNPDKIAGGVALLQVFSESSTDEGVSYTTNPDSLRPLEVSNAGESFKTTVSFLEEWSPGQIVRFRIFEDNGVALNITTSSTTALNQTVDGHSVIWVLGEN